METSKEAVYVSQTGLRLLMILKLLVEKPRSKKELLDILSELANEGKLSPDTITIDINTLNEAGVKIIIATKATDYQYILDKNSFGFELTKNQIESLNFIKSAALNTRPLDFILDLIEFYKFINIFTKNCDESILNFDYLNGLNFDLISDLRIAIKENKKVTVIYQSKSHNKRKMDILPLELRIESGKLYLWGFCNEYNDQIYLRLDKFIGVCPVKDEKPIQNERDYQIAKYELRNDATLLFEPNKDKKILKKENNYLLIEEKIKSEFHILKEILSYGNDCKLLSPIRLIEKIKEELVALKNIYTK